MVQSALDSPPPHLVEAVKKREKRDASLQEKTFDFSWDDPSGRTWAGAFTSRVPNIGQQIEIAKVVARKSHGTGEGKLPDDVADLIYTIAYLETALVSRPDWAKDLESLPYMELVNGLAGEATAHLQSFRQRPGGTGSSSRGVSGR